MTTKRIELQENKQSPQKKKPTGNQETIKTFCRIRPFNGINELFKPSPTDNKTLLINSQNLPKTTQSKISSYTFSKVFDETSTQEEVFNDTCKQIIMDLLEKGKSGLIFTYGMTNAGKTFTVTGTPSSPGILPQTLKFLFEEKKNLSLYCNFVEIYQEDVFDLLSVDPQKKNKFYKKKIDVKQNQMNLFYLNDVTYEKLSGLEEFDSLLNRGIAKKVHSATQLNQNSSRSHTIFKIVLRDEDDEFDYSNVTRYPTLSIVDLAGSERANRTEASGKELQEACKINSSLSILGKCLEAMKHNSIFTQKKLVPFRESKLTKLFCEYFQGEQNIIMITNINPRKEDFEETLRALNYSCIAKEIKPIKSRIVFQKQDYNPIKKKNVNFNKQYSNNTTLIDTDLSESNENEEQKEDEIEVVNISSVSDHNSTSLTEVSSDDQISRLILEIKKLREEVESLKSSPNINEKKLPPKEEPKLLPSAKEIEERPEKALELVPNNMKNGINFIFINSRFSDFHMGKNGPILEEEEEEDEERKPAKKKKKKNPPKKQNKKRKSNKGKKNQKIDKYQKKLTFDSCPSTPIRKKEENCENTETKKKEEPFIIETKIEVKPKSKDDCYLRTVKRPKCSMFDQLIF